MNSALFNQAVFAVSLALQTTLPLVLGLVALYLLRLYQPGVRCLLARATAVSVALSLCVAPLLLGRSTALWRFSLSATPTSVSRTHPSSLTQNQATDSTPLEPKAPREISTPSSAALPTYQSSKPVTHSEIPASPPPSPPTIVSSDIPLLSPPISSPSLHSQPSHQLSFSNWGRSLFWGAVVLWGLGTVGSLAWLFTGNCALWRLRRAAKPVENSALREITQSLCRSALVHTPLLLESVRVQSPFLCGLCQPSIVLPRGFAALAQEATRAILAHEISHLKRRDLWWQTGTRCLCALLWWHPLVWMLARELEAAQEDCCDQAVLSSGCAAQTYANCLLDFAEQWNLRPVERVAGLGVIPSRSALARRVQRIMEKPSELGLSTFGRRVTVGALLLCGVSSQLLVAAEKTPQSSPVNQPTPAPQNSERLQNLNAEVLSLAFSPDGRQIAQGCLGGLIQVYDFKTKKMSHSLKGRSNQVSALAWSRNGLLANSLGELWDTTFWQRKPKPVYSLPQLSPSYSTFNVSFAWNAEGNLLASGGAFRTIMRREGKTWRSVRNEVSRDWIYDMQFSPDGRFLAEGRMNGLSIWNAQLLKQSNQLKPVPLYNKTRSISLPRLNSKMTAAQQQAALAEIRRALASSPDFTGGITKVAFSPDSKLLAVAYGGMLEAHYGNKNGGIVVWDTDTWEEKRRFPFPGASATALAWSPDSRLLAGGEGELLGQQRGTQKNDIKIWNITNGQLTATLHAHTAQINALAWSPRGTILASGSRDHTMRLWSIDKAGQISRWADGMLWRPSHPVENGSPTAAINSFYRELNTGNVDNTSTMFPLLWARPIGGVDMSGLRDSLAEVSDHSLKLKVSNLRIATSGDEASATYRVSTNLPASQQARLQLNRIALGQVHANLRRSRYGWQLYEEPSPIQVGNTEIVGRVVDEEGKPVANVGIMTRIIMDSQPASMSSFGEIVTRSGRHRIYSQRASMSSFINQMRTVPISSPFKTRLFSRTLATHDLTRADGTFRLTGISAGKYRVTITTETSSSEMAKLGWWGLPSGYVAPVPQTVTLKGNMANSIPDIVLKRGVTVRGRILDGETSKGLGQMSISGVAASAEKIAYIVQTQTNKKGDFEITLPNGSFILLLPTRYKRAIATIPGGDSTYSTTKGIKVSIDGTAYSDKSWNLHKELPLQGQVEQTIDMEVRLQKVNPVARTR